MFLCYTIFHERTVVFQQIKLQITAGPLDASLALNYWLVGGSTGRGDAQCKPLFVEIIYRSHEK